MTSYETNSIMDSPKNWKDYIEDEMQKFGDSWENVVSCAPSEEKICEMFEIYDGYICDPNPFTLWTETRVYFPAWYDSQFWVESVSREPDGKPTNHELFPL